MIISIGTGSCPMTNPKELLTCGIIGWMTKGNLISTLYEARTQDASMLASKEYCNSCRLQLNLGQNNTSMDNASPDNMQALLKLADEYIQANSENIDNIIKILEK